MHTPAPQSPSIQQAPFWPSWGIGLHTLYRDFGRFDAERCRKLEAIVARAGLARVAQLCVPMAHMEVDTYDGSRERGGAMVWLDPSLRDS